MDQVGNGASTGKVTYTLSNYLGTPVLNTDDRGDIIEANMTDVFGNYVYRDTRNDSALHTKAFTSHEFDDVTGLTYSHARYLDTTAHSFLSVDPMIYALPQSYLYDPQQMNSYAYARNNPIIYTDPTGEFTVPSFTGFVTGAVMGAIKGVVSGVSAIGNAIMSPQATYNSVVSGAKAVQNYVSNTSVSTMASQAKGAILSGGSSLVNAYNTTTFSQGYTAGQGTAGSIATTVATLGAGAAVKGLGLAGALSDIRTATVATEVAGSVSQGAKATAAASSFFDGAYFGKETLQKMGQNDFHNFPSMVRNFESDGVVSTFLGGDKRTYTKLMINGSYMGREGAFVYIKNSLGEIKHRMFEAN